jgi:citrate synthase
MSFMPKEQTTRIATHTNEDIFIRDRSLCGELIGHLSFTQMMYFQILGTMPTPGQCTMVDACLVTLMEHGLTPSALATRLVYSSAPEAMQAAVSSGLMCVGSVFVGTMEGCAALIEQILAADDRDAEALRIARDFRARKAPLPGFGHHMHKPDDPRSIRLFELARGHGVAGPHVAALESLAAAVDATYGKHITINATGAIAAVLGDAGVPAQIMRGFALISRCAGLVGHVHEEQGKPAMRAIWESAEHAVKYDGEVKGRTS